MTRTPVYGLLRVRVRPRVEINGTARGRGVKKVGTIFATLANHPDLDYGQFCYLAIRKRRWVTGYGNKTRSNIA